MRGHRETLRPRWVATATLVLAILLSGMAQAAFSPLEGNPKGKETPTQGSTPSAASAGTTAGAVKDPSGHSSAGATSTPEPAASPTMAAPQEEASPDAPPAPHLDGVYAGDEVLVRFRRRAAKAASEACLQASQAEVTSEIEALGVLVLSVPNGEVARAVQHLSQCHEIRLVEPNYLVSIADTIPTDASFGLQYGLISIRAPQGWDLQTGSSAVTIAVLDTGVDAGHVDLGAKIVGGHDFVNDDANPADDHGHGTHVAGIAAALANNGAGVAGVSWGARIMPVKVLNAAGNGTFADVAAGIVWAADNGAQVINLSLGGTSPSTVLQDAVDYAHARGVVIVAASGNTGANFILYPARYSNVIAVGATDASNVRAGISNFGPELDLVAPGVNIYSTRPGGAYGYLTGTSMAAGYVSGLAAILRGMSGSGSPDVIAFQMQNTALDLGTAGADELYGYGLIQMDSAILAAAPAPAQGVIEPEGGRTAASSGAGPAQVPYSPTPQPASSITHTPLTTATAATTSATAATTDTPEVWALSHATPTHEQEPRAALPDLGEDWPMGCSGAVLIVGGAALAAYLSRRRRPRGHHLHFR